MELTDKITMRTQAANVNRERCIDNLRILEVYIRDRRLTLCKRTLDETISEHTAYIIAKEASFDLQTKRIELMPNECSTHANTQLVQDKADHENLKEKHANIMKGIKLRISDIALLEVCPSRGPL